ncbi:MAG TPA: hypothetical protein VN222_15035 [Novosphingobium sp.]|nr:hypothetical protein [Novosphingobium sp.]
MKKLLLPLAIFAVIAAPAAASAEQCRNAKGQFAKCGTPGAKPVGAARAAKPAGPAMAAKPVGPAMAAKPAATPAKAAPCKDAKGKFIKCAPKK